MELENNNIKTIAEILQWAKQQCPDAYDVDWLLASFLKVKPSYLFIHPEQPVEEPILKQMQAAIVRLKAGEPLAYILNTQAFWSIELDVDNSVLIPRPDTETLVMTTLQLAKINYKNILDLGTGSGAIAIALAVEQPNWQITAIDKSRSALQIANKNLHKYNLTNLKLLQSNWFSALDSNNDKFDIIVSNPPYIANNDKHLTDLKDEPIAALVAGIDGLDAYREIIPGATSFLNTDGYLILEHGALQGNIIRDFLQCAGYKEVKTVLDYGQNERVSYGRYRK